MASWRPVLSVPQQMHIQPEFGWQPELEPYGWQPELEPYDAVRQSIEQSRQDTIGTGLRGCMSVSMINPSFSPGFESKPGSFFEFHDAPITRLSVPRAVRTVSYVNPPRTVSYVNPAGVPYDSVSASQYQNDSKFQALASVTGSLATAQSALGHLVPSYSLSSGFADSSPADLVIDPCGAPAFASGGSITITNPAPVMVAPTSVRRVTLRRSAFGAQQSKAGIGIKFVTNKVGEHVITYLKTGGVADKSARIAPGDKIFEVNGQPVTGLPGPKVTELILGEPGTDVSLFLVPSNDAVQTANRHHDSQAPIAAAKPRSQPLKPRSQAPIAAAQAQSPIAAVQAPIAAANEGWRCKACQTDNKSTGVTGQACAKCSTPRTYYRCDYNCGFVSSFDLVQLHEKACPRKDAARHVEVLRRASLDEHTAAPASKVGIGITILSHGCNHKGEWEHIIKAIRAGGASEESACVFPGDIILEVDGTLVSNLPCSQVKQLVVGTPGTKARLLLLGASADRLGTPEKGQGGSSIQEKPQQESKDELVEMYETVLAEERQRRDAAERMLEQQERAATQHLAQVMVKTDAVARPASESAPGPTSGSADDLTASLAPQAKPTSQLEAIDCGQGAVAAASPGNPTAEVERFAPALSASQTLSPSARLAEQRKRWAQQEIADLMSFTGANKPAQKQSGAGPAGASAEQGQTRPPLPPASAPAASEVEEVVEVSRGPCTLCGKPVLVSQERESDGVNYTHAVCIQAETQRRMGPEVPGQIQQENNTSNGQKSGDQRETEDEADQDASNTDGPEAAPSASASATAADTAADTLCAIACVLCGRWRVIEDQYAVCMSSSNFSCAFLFDTFCNDPCDFESLSNIQTLSEPSGPGYAGVFQVQAEDSRGPCRVCGKLVLITQEREFDGVAYAHLACVTVEPQDGPGAAAESYSARGRSFGALNFKAEGLEPVPEADRLGSAIINLRPAPKPQVKKANRPVTRMAPQASSSRPKTVMVANKSQLAKTSTSADSAF